jgi:hypothetical protein
MDGLQHQINTLNQKVEQLHQIVERLTGQLTGLASYNAASSLTSSDKPLQPLPKLSHREEKSAYAHAHLIGSQENEELVGNGHHHSNSYGDSTELIGNGYHHDKNYNSPYVSDYQLDPQKGYYRATMEHKDVLLEDEMPKTTLPDPLHEPSVASDIQIRRLMAQLTAAYNRIAILEEQLVACRMK